MVEAPVAHYAISLRSAMDTPAPFTSLIHAMSWIRLQYPGAYYDLEYQDGRATLVVFWSPDNRVQIRVGSIENLIFTPQKD